MGRRKKYSRYYQYRYGLTQTISIGGERFTCVSHTGSHFGGTKKTALKSARKHADKIRDTGHKARILKDSNDYLYVFRGPMRKK